MQPHEATGTEQPRELADEDSRRESALRRNVFIVERALQRTDLDPPLRAALRARLAGYENDLADLKRQREALLDQAARANPGIFG